MKILGSLIIVTASDSCNYQLATWPEIKMEALNVKRPLVIKGETGNCPLPRNNNSGICRRVPVFLSLILLILSVDSIPSFPFFSSLWSLIALSVRGEPLLGL